MPNIYDFFSGSVKSCSGSGEVISSTSYQSTSFSRGDLTSGELQEEDAHQANIELNRLQTASETNNSFSSTVKMRTRAMRLSERREQERLSDHDFMNSISTNSNNNAALKRGARDITLWKANAEDDDGIEVERKQARGRTSRISSMFGKCPHSFSSFIFFEIGDIHTVAYRF